MSLILAGMIPAVLQLTHLRSFLFFPRWFRISNAHVHHWLALTNEQTSLWVREVRLYDSVSVFGCDLLP